jgi:hypothetical protein
MALPVIAGVARASLAGQVAGGGRWSNTWHARRIDLGDPTAVSVALLEADLVAFYATAILSNCHTGTTLDAVDITPLDGSSGAFHTTLAIDGSGSGDSLPPEVSCVITIRTGARGRRSRGRVYLPAFVIGALSPTGQLGTATNVGIQAVITTLAAAVLVSGWELGVASYGVSRKYDRTVRPPRIVETTWTPFFTPQTSMSMDSKFDVQRNRKA